MSLKYFLYHPYSWTKNNMIYSFKDFIRLSKNLNFNLVWISKNNFELICPLFFFFSCFWHYRSKDIWKRGIHDVQEIWMINFIHVCIRFNDWAMNNFLLELIMFNKQNILHVQCHRRPLTFYQRPPCSLVRFLIIKRNDAGLRIPWHSIFNLVILTRPWLGFTIIFFLSLVLWKNNEYRNISKLIRAYKLRYFHTIETSLHSVKG